jgi:hypothetical protein
VQLLPTLTRQVVVILRAQGSGEAATADPAHKTRGAQAAVRRLTFVHRTFLGQRLMATGYAGSGRLGRQHCMGLPAHGAQWSTNGWPSDIAIEATRCFGERPARHRECPCWWICRAAAALHTTRCCATGRSCSFDCSEEAWCCVSRGHGRCTIASECALASQCCPALTMLLRQCCCITPFQSAPFLQPRQPVLYFHVPQGPVVDDFSAPACTLSMCNWQGPPLG